MGQQISWFLFEVRDLWFQMWNSSTYLFILILVALAGAGWFSLRRS